MTVEPISGVEVQNIVPIVCLHMNAQVMELVYVLVLEAKFCEFESRPGHQVL